MTMPAIAPPERPDPDGAAAAPTVVADGIADAVLEGNRGAIDLVVGSTIPGHRFPTLALAQHELVALTAGSLQYEQSPCRLSW
jgi:hypothetical protein